VRTTEIEQVVAEVATLLRERYVFPEPGARMAAELERRSYRGAGSAQRLAEQITADLRAVSGDKHLALRYSASSAVAEPDFWVEGARTSAGGMARVEVLPGNVGYLAIRPALFPASVAGGSVTAAMTLLADTEALMLDLRECQGGAPDLVVLICSYLFDEPVHLNDLVERDPAELQQFWTLPYVAGRRYGADRPVYVLTGARTFSGAEELAYNLQQQGRATVVGERTGGGANPVKGFPVHPELEVLVPVATARNPVTGTNWEDTGVVPDVGSTAEEALDTALRLAAERRASDGR
jgi:C-terminal processing protease CtpA/Prc